MEIFLIHCNINHSLLYALNFVGGISLGIFCGTFDVDMIMKMNLENVKIDADVEKILDELSMKSLIEVGPVGFYHIHPAIKMILEYHHKHETDHNLTQSYNNAYISIMGDLRRNWNMGGNRMQLF